VSWTVFAVVLLCGSTDFVHTFMMAARDHGMTGGDYVFIATNIVQPDIVYRPSLTNYSHDANMMAAYFPLLQVQASLLVSGL